MNTTLLHSRRGREKKTKSSKEFDDYIFIRSSKYRKSILFALSKFGFPLSSADLKKKVLNDVSIIIHTLKELRERGILDVYNTDAHRDRYYILNKRSKLVVEKIKRYESWNSI